MPDFPNAALSESVVMRVQSEYTERWCNRSRPVLFGANSFAGETNHLRSAFNLTHGLQNLYSLRWHEMLVLR